MRITDKNGIQRIGDIEGRDASYYVHAGSYPHSIWYPATGNTAAGLGAASTVASGLRAYPFIAPLRDNVSVSGIGVVVTVGNNTNPLASGILGIYTNLDENNLYPHRLLSVCEPFATQTNGEIIRASITGQLNPGELYWIAELHNRTITLRSYVTTSFTGPLGHISSFVSVSQVLNWAATHTFDTISMPSIFPAGASVVQATPMPVVYLSFSS